jgi:RNA polymerase sigma factor (TIGR02999 family)
MPDGAGGINPNPNCVDLFSSTDNSRTLPGVSSGAFFAGFVASEEVKDGIVSELTRILEAAQRGEPSAADKLLPLVYDELRRLAAQKMAHEVPGQTLQPTALVHEAWLRLVGNQNTQWNGRAHFFGAAAEAMRRILIENARRKNAARHGGGQMKLNIQEFEIASEAKDHELFAVHDALEKFALRDRQKAELVKLRYFVGLTTEEAAEVLGISIPTADRWWNFSRAWLFEEIECQRRG